ncbi:hypothetical protein [Tropicibacter sp. Alg240-R139]|uniref:hypothetical protein n=1 Tax=Tropicibacter sp. Alg240-R139 TaxID=2305991 RepID=UPI0013DEB26C|nr:hypothetical protein [Tropicibacter sp. Alg240-R139]
MSELAEKLGTTPKDLYEKLQITAQASGETMTLGQLKDAVQDQETATRELVAKEQSVTQRESAVLQSEQLLAAIQGDLVGKLSPQALQQVQQRQQQRDAQEARLMQQAMPELSDKQSFDTFRTGVVETLTQYGFQPAEMNITDHRILLMIRDHMRTKAQLSKLMAFDPEKDKKPPKSAKSQTKQSRGRSPHRNRNTRGSETDRMVSEIAAIFEGG